MLHSNFSIIWDLIYFMCYVCYLHFVNNVELVLSLSTETYPMLAILIHLLILTLNMLQSKPLVTQV